MDVQHICIVTLILEKWPWVKVMTHRWVMDNKCVKYYSYPTLQWGVMVQTRIWNMYALRPWPWRYDLWSRSWHILGSWTTIVSNLEWVRSYHDVNRRTDRQTGWFLYIITIKWKLWKCKIIDMVRVCKKIPNFEQK